MKPSHPIPYPDAAPAPRRKVKPRIHTIDRCGLTGDAAAALATLDRLAASGQTGIAGVFMPSPWISKALAGAGIAEQLDPADAIRFRHIIVPYTGLPPSQHALWQASSNGRLHDLSAPAIRHALATAERLVALRAETLVIGRHHDDPATATITDDGRAARILENTEDTARLTFAPHFGALCNPWISPRRVAWLADQLRLRYRDARVTFIDTTCPAMIERERALESRLATADRVVIVGDPGDDTCQALAEAAARRGIDSAIATTATRLPWRAYDGTPRNILITAGGFTPQPAIQAMARALAR